jgi:hypothetical protein
MGIGCTIVSALAAVLVFCEMAIRSNMKIEARHESAPRPMNPANQDARIFKLEQGRGIRTVPNGP